MPKIAKMLLEKANKVTQLVVKPYWNQLRSYHLTVVKSQVQQWRPQWYTAYIIKNNKSCILFLNTAKSSTRQIENPCDESQMIKYLDGGIKIMEEAETSK